jgi:nucleoside-diphosphate-sugar epimerase
MRILIAGCGYIGTALGVRLAADGHTVWGMRRRPNDLPAGLQAVAADLTAPETLRDLPAALDMVFYTAGAGGSTDEAYRLAYVEGVHNLLEALHAQRQRLRRIFFTSSTGVYGQSNGEWVDETSLAQPQHVTGQRLLEGERLLLAGPVPATVVRLAGIYGPGRTRLINQVRQGLVSYSEEMPLYTNRIHRDDCVGVLRYLMRLVRPASLYVGVDYRPVERGTLLRWLAGQLGAPPPGLEPSDPLSVRQRRSNKRCRNSRLVAAGYTFRYPSFQHGYGALLAQLAAQESA